MSIFCPSCESKHIVKNGKIHNGKQNYKCRDCGRQFVDFRQQKIISQTTKDLIDKLLLEKLPLAGIARVTEVSEPRLPSYVNAKYESVSRQVKVQEKKREINYSVRRNALKDTAPHMVICQQRQAISSGFGWLWI